jgi:hypothetical protein
LRPGPRPRTPRAPGAPTPGRGPTARTPRAGSGFAGGGSPTRPRSPATGRTPPRAQPGVVGDQRVDAVDGRGQPGRPGHHDEMAAPVEHRQSARTGIEVAQQARRAP